VSGGHGTNCSRWPARGLPDRCAHGRDRQLWGRGLRLQGIVLARRSSDAISGARQAADEATRCDDTRVVVLDLLASDPRHPRPLARPSQVRAVSWVAHQDRVGLPLHAVDQSSIAVARRQPLGQNSRAQRPRSVHSQPGSHCAGSTARRTPTVRTVQIPPAGHPRPVHALRVTTALPAYTAAARPPSALTWRLTFSAIAVQWFSGVCARAPLGHGNVQRVDYATWSPPNLTTPHPAVAPRSFPARARPLAARLDDA